MKIARVKMGARVTMRGYKRREIRGGVRIRRHKLKGRKHFQVIIIKRSYRIRGKAARTQINSVATMVVIMRRAKGVRKRGVGVKRNKAEDRRLTTKMLQYSAIKIRANFPPPYSILNPDTSSDSPSAKSKGARFVSASSVTNHAIDNGGIRNRRGVEWLKVGEEKLNDKSRVSAEIRRRAIEIS